MKPPVDTREADAPSAPRPRVPEGAVGGASPLANGPADTGIPSPRSRRRPPGANAKSLTIGAVCKQLEREFPDISISKIRYLEDQKLVSPRRTPGGYRLYAAADVARLRTILKLQRDEFLPLRVIRQELAAGRVEPEEAEGGAPRPDARSVRRTSVVDSSGGARYGLAEILEDTGAEASLVRELEEYGVIRGERRDGQTLYDDTEREIVRAVTELARFGVGGRNLRVFRTSADREAALLEQILAPSLRSRNPERRREAVEVLENLAAIASHLKYLLLVRDLRKITS